jgi:hypothetical protein
MVTNANELITQGDYAKVCELFKKGKSRYQVKSRNGLDEAFNVKMQGDECPLQSNKSPNGVTCACTPAQSAHWAT